MNTIRFAAVTLALLVAVGFAIGQDSPEPVPIPEPAPNASQGDAANTDVEPVPMPEPAPNVSQGDAANVDAVDSEPVEPTPVESIAVAAQKIDLQQAFHRMAHEAVAARIGLTDAQRAEVQRLINLRSQQLATAPPEQWAEVIEKSEQQLADVLTPAQKTLWPKLFEEKLVYFRFRGQAWTDVLYWFADQLGLQLVMDAPPPGTFNFSSQRGYTPSEAVDLLNSVLQTKGYTLIRNDRMLMLFDLKRGAIPVQFLPVLRPDQLPDRGRFEYTTSIFSLERRNRADAIQAIEPFKGPYCKIVPMPGNSVMVTDTAGTLLVLERVMMAIENPPAPPPPPQQQPPLPPPTWKTYTVEKNDPTRIETIFKEFAPPAKILRIGNSRELHVQLPEPSHEGLEKILEMLENDSGLTDGEMTLATYSLDTLSPQRDFNLARQRRTMGGPFGQTTPIPFPMPTPADGVPIVARDVIAILQQTFPTAVVSETPAGSNIVVLASKTDHEKIKEFFDSIKQNQPTENDPVAKLYKFTDPAKKINDDVYRQLRNALPLASLSLDEQQGHILVVATAKEQELVATAVKELEAATLPEEGKLVVAYPASASVASRFTSLFRQLSQNKELDGAVNLIDTKQNQITIWATAAQHEIIKNLIDELTGSRVAATEAEPTLRVFPLDYASGYTTQVMLANIIPNADFSYDPRTNAVVAHATPDVLEVIEKAVTELDKSTGFNVAFIPVKRALSGDEWRQLYRSAPNTVVIQSPRSMVVVATGPKAELEKVKAVLAASETVIPAEAQTIVHSFNTASPYTATAVLADIFPELRPTINLANNQIIVQVLAEQVEPVTSLFTQLDGDLEFVPLTKEISAEVRSTFLTIAPRATVIIDRENSQAMIQGPKPDVEKIKKMIESSEKSTALPEEIYVHTFRQAYPYYAMTLLQTIYPEVRVAGYPTAKQLAVRLRPEMKDKVLKLFEELDGEIDFVPLKKELSPELVASFATIAPYASVVIDRKSSQAMIYGPTPEVEKIKKIITASEAAAPLDEEILVYTFKSAMPYYAYAVLREIYPDIRIALYPTARQLTLRVRPDQREAIEKLLDDMDGDIVIIPLKKELSPELLAACPQIAPYATVIVDQRNSLAMVYGLKPDVEKIQQLITTSEAAVPVSEDVIVHNLRNVESPTIVGILQEIHPDARIKDDPENNRLVIRVRPDQTDAVKSLLAQLDVADPDREKRYFKAYPLDTGLYSLDAAYSPYTPVTFVGDLQKLAPKAKISFDRTSRQLIVFGTEEEHKVVEAAVGNLNGDGNKKEYGRFQLRRANPYTLAVIIHRLFPTVIPTYEFNTGTIIVEGHPKMIAKVKELLETIDPAEPSPSDPVVRFYTLNAEPTPTLVQGLLRLVPTAMIVPETEAKQIMVVAKPDEQKIIENNVQVIVSTYTAPEEPMLFIYTATQEQRESLQAFVLTAAADLKGVTIVPDRTPNRVSIWAKPSEHQLIAAVLKQMEESKANEPLRQLKVFHMSIGDLATAQELLKVSYPEATLFVDTTGNRLLVWATAEELEKVTQTLTVQGNFDNRQMLAYPVAGAQPETLMKVIQDVFQGLKITPELQTRRLLVWAAPDEHVKIAEIVEQANKKEDPESELAEKFVAYSSAQLNPLTVLALFRALIPDADVYADPTADKITVRARAREHVQIKELLEQLRQKDEKLRPILKVYPFGETDPVMIEAMLRAQLPNAESMSPDQIVRLLGGTYYYERMPWYRSYYGQSAQRKIGYYKVDPQTQSVYVFVSGDDHAEISEAVAQLVAAGNQEGIKPVLRRYSLDDMSYYDISRLLQQVAPSAHFEVIYSYTPMDGGQFNWAAGLRDFLAYTRESEHEKIDALVKELNDRAGTGRKEMLSITLPEGTKYPRQQILDLLRRLYPDLNPMPGAAPNQILVWAQKHRLTLVQQVVDEACKPLPDGQQTVVKSYVLQYISVDEAAAWLKAVVPNVSFDPQQPGAVPAVPPARFQRPDGGKVIVAVATPLEHFEIAKILSELDKDLPETHKMVTKFYGVDDYPLGVFWPLYMSLYQMFPNAVVTPNGDQRTFMIVATEDYHQKIAAFLQSYKDDREERRPYLEVYGLKNLNYYRVSSLIARVAPQAFIVPGAKPEQIGVWGTPKEHLDVSTALTKLETTANAESVQSLKLYKVGGKKAVTAAQMLQYQFPGTMTFASSADEILSWGSPADHNAIAEMLQVVAEAYPNPVLKTYTFKHVPLGQGYLVLQQIYPVSDAAITQRLDTGDLIVSAPPAIQERIARDIAAFDVPRPADTERLPVAYDLSDIPQGYVWYAAQMMRTALPETIILPSGIPGQFVVWGRAAEQEKIRAMVDQMLTEQPSNTSRMELYAIRRGTAQLAQQTILPIVPNVRFGYGLNPNQLLVWAKDSEHTKIKNVIDKLNEPDADVAFETYSLKNIYTVSALNMVRNLIQTQGLDVRITQDFYNNQLVVQGRAEDQKLIKELLGKLKSEDRELAVFTLERNDPDTAYRAINTLFIDESYYSAPVIEVDLNTNMLFIQGTKEQLDRIRKMLVEMGETHLGRARQADPADTGVLPRAGQNQLRVIRLSGSAADTIRELEKLWPLHQPNRLLINRQDQPLIQQRDDAAPSSQEPGVSTPGLSESGLFSIDDREPVDQPHNVYVTINEDDSITVASFDTEALDRLEQLLQRINDRIVFEGRDYTIYSVRNISATMVAMRLQQILWARLAGQQQRLSTGTASRFQPPPLTIQPDEATNTIYVRGARAERTEVANLIAMLDVSELPGERMVRKPVKVPIKNTQASRIVQQVLNVYQQKMMATRLPGGVFPRVTVDNVTNSVEIIAPEPLSTELKEYAEDLDRRTVEEPARKVHVIPLEVKAPVVRQALQVIQQQSAFGSYGQPMMMPGMMQPRMAR